MYIRTCRSHLGVNSFGPLINTVEPYLTDTLVAIYSIADTSYDPECILICLCTFKTPETRTPVFHKLKGSPVPTVPELYKIHSIIWTLVYYFRKIVHHIRWIQRPGNILALSLIVLTFLNLVRQWKGPKMWPCRAPSLSTHYHAYQKCTGSPWSTNTFMLWTHSSGPNSVRFRGAPLLYLSVRLRSEVKGGIVVNFSAWMTWRAGYGRGECWIKLVMTGDITRGHMAETNWVIKLILLPLK